ncbi:hypothetical protein HK096_010287, partial [Nowakowskiella sp. JEL0078]
IQIDKHGGKQAVASDSRLFKTLVNTWKLQAIGENKTLVDFKVEFEFRSLLHEQVAGMFVQELSMAIMKSFEDQANERYNSKK